MLFLFPFEKVHPHERIVLYGYGQVGRQFLKQIEQTQYCEVVAIIDHHYDIYADVKHEIFPIEKIMSLTYEKVIIAINNLNVANNIRETLMHKYSIREECIIVGANRKLIFGEPHTHVPVKYTGKGFDDENLQAAFYLGMGLGDAIIAKVFIEQFIRCFLEQCEVDIFTTPDGYTSVKAIFGKVPFVRNIGIRGQEKNIYDFSISVSYCLKDLKFNEKTIREKSPKIADMLCKLQDKICTYGLDFKKGFQYRIHFDRCRVSGYTCYTAYNYYDVCNIRDWHTLIPLSPKHESVYKALGLKKFITINYGWGLSDDGIGYPPNKVWPIANFNVLVALLRRRFPEYNFIQVGLKYSDPITGIDQYILGNNLEVVKYILRDALLHIDCEGGLVHLATQLGTKCVVLFGPTPVYYFGYEENINIVADKCKDCYYMYDDFSACARGLNCPECMYSITPEMVMGKIEEYFNSEYSSTKAICQFD